MTDNQLNLSQIARINNCQKNQLSVSFILMAGLYICIYADNSVPIGYTQPTGYGQPAGMVGYQQPAMIGAWQPAMMGMPGMVYGPQPGMMVAPGPAMQPRLPMGYMQQPAMAMGMQTPAGYQPSTYSTSLQAGPSLLQ